MVYAGIPSQPSIRELARQGNLRAIAHWLNCYLAPRGIVARLARGRRSGCLRVLLELSPDVGGNPRSQQFRHALVRFICQRLWKLNSAQIDGVRIVARPYGETTVLWQQSVRILTPANRDRVGIARRKPLPVRPIQRHHTHPKLISLLLNSSAAAAFLVGLWMGYKDSPSEQTNAVASPQPEAVATSPAPDRPNIVKTALEMVPVSSHTQVQDPNDPTVTLMFAGDVTLTDAYSDLIGSNHKWAFARMDEYRKVDVAMVNLESPLTRALNPLPNKQFNFKSDPDTVQVLQDGGIDIVNLANNHTMDYEAEGLDETLDTLKRAGITQVGAGRNVQEARRPQILDVKGQRIAYLGYYSMDFQAATDNAPGTNYADEARIAEDIQAIRNQVDWVIVNYHWGQELADRPADWQIDLAHFTIDQGADVVVGHHPHVLQGAEIYKGRPIAYSLGNFIFGGNSRSDYDTAVLKVSLKDRQMKVEFLPVEVRKYQPQVVKGDRGAEILQQIDSLSTIFEQPMQSPMILDAKSNNPVNGNPVNGAQPTPPASPTPDSAPGNDNTAPGAPTSPQPSATSEATNLPSWQPKAPWKTQPFLQPDQPEQPATDPATAPNPADSPTSQSSPEGQANPRQGHSPAPRSSLEPMKRHFADAAL